MRTRSWLSAGAALLLVVGVLATRGGSAAGKDDLRAVTASPSVAPSAPPGEPTVAPLVLQAHGTPGVRLGASGEGLETAVPVRGPEAVDDADLPGGCVPAWSAAADRSSQQWETAAWLVDGRVASVVLSRWDPTTAVLPDLRTWLGPTIGSPVAEASALPGARTRLERPFGADGPVVTVVHVPGDETEVVFSDAANQMASRSEDAVGRITTVEVRYPSARPCSFEAFLESRLPGPEASQAPDELVLGADGLTTAPIGTPVATVRALRGMAEELPGRDGCESFFTSSATGASVRLVAVDGVVVQAQAYGPVVSALAVQMGDPMGDVRLAYPALTDHNRDHGLGSHEVVLGPRVLGIELYPGNRWVPDVDVAVTGGPAQVHSLSVRDAAADTARLC